MAEMTEQEKNYLVLSALETIRLYQYMPFNLRYFKPPSLSITLETLYSDYFKEGYLHIVQSICAVEIGAGTPQIKIGINDRGTKLIFTSGTPAAAENSVDYIGQLLVPGGCRIFADFEGATATDTAYLYINGYRIRFK